LTVSRSALLTPIGAALFALAVLLVWQYSVDHRMVSPIFVASPTGIGSALTRLAASGELWDALAPTLARMLGGWAVAAVLGVALALPMAPGLRSELANVKPPGSDFFATLSRMHTELPRAIDAYDPALLGPPPFPAALSAASSVLAPWSLGHFVLYEAEQPVVANNFGYGFLDSIRFFLATSEEDALAIARRRRSRWILVTDLAPRLNDYASYLERPPLLARTPEGRLVPTPAYFATMQARLYDFGGRGGEVGGVTIPPLSRIRLLFHSRSANLRGGRYLPVWSVFEITEP